MSGSNSHRESKRSQGNDFSGNLPQVQSSRGFPYQSLTPRVPRWSQKWSVCAVSPPLISVLPWIHPHTGTLPQRYKDKPGVPLANWSGRSSHLTKGFFSWPPPRAFAPTSRKRTGHKHICWTSKWPQPPPTSPSHELIGTLSKIPVRPGTQVRPSRPSESSTH